jgi:hypothetical protein
MENMEIRKQIAEAGLKHWQVAKTIGISSYTFCVWLREELTGERLGRVQAAMQKLQGRAEHECERV